ncbi:MAG: hypothetical protein M1825_003788 [Sarcosagium campestre]|nr:MAG: hypothetical protein M1825_003788 [Sarcosagium campestre]
MPEIGEVARVVHYLKKHIVGKTISNVQVQDDDIVYGKVGTTAAQFKKAVSGKKVLDAGQQGKTFWITMSSPPHICLNLGMTGWIKFSNDDSSYYKTAKDEEEPESWPPRFWKFVLETKESPKSEAAFVDPRRLARIRLLDCPADAIRSVPPFSNNGPDPVQDQDKLTVDWLTQKVQSKRVPVKAFLLNQANISGVGNWVADEVLYDARIHPEQYTNSLQTTQIKQLHTSLVHICSVAVETLADSSKFPHTWLMKYRWDRGKKTNSKLPNGASIKFLTVGGRTSAVVPSVQKKTGPVAGELDDENDDDDDDEPAEGPAEGESEAEKVTVKSKAKPKASAAKKAASTPQSKHQGAARPNGEKATKTGKPSKKIADAPIPSKLQQEVQQQEEKVSSLAGSRKRKAGPPPTTDPPSTAAAAAAAASSKTASSSSSSKKKLKKVADAQVEDPALAPAPRRRSARFGSGSS